MRTSLLAAWIVLAGAAASCGGGSGPADAAPSPVDAGPYVYRTCDPALRVGDFRIDLDTSFTAVTGSIASGVVPSHVPRLIKEAGSCRLHGLPNLFCDPPCAGGMTCGEARQCLPYPTGRSAGTVSITGLATPVVMMPSPQGRRYDYTRLPHPGFAPGAEIQLQASGAEIAPFVLQGRGIAPLVLLSEGTVLEPGKDLVIRWTAGPPGPARIAFELAIDQHGATRATLACDVPDDGMATVPAALIDELVALGASGLPRLRISRRTADASPVTGGCAELLVSATIERAIKVPGHDPCRSDADCPMGKTCAVAIETCR